MPDKEKHLIVTPGESDIHGSVPFRIYFAGWLLANGYDILGDKDDKRAADIKRLSGYLGVTREMIYLMLGGKLPGKATREKLGIKPVLGVVKAPDVKADQKLKKK